MREIPNQLGIDSNDKIPGLKKLVDELHHNGAKAIAHLNHPGRMANPNIPGNYFISATEKACENGGARTVQMDRKMMDTAVNPKGNGTIFATARKKGIDALHVSAGSSCSTPPWFFQHMFVPKGRTWQLASEIKAAVSVPVIFVGQINTRDDIQILEDQYEADFIALGRAMVTDPNFVSKLNDENSNIRPCLTCSGGCLGNIKQGKGLGCVVNPFVNNEMPPLKKTESSQKIAVIGGGLAGMQTATVLKER